MKHTLFRLLLIAVLTVSSMDARSQTSAKYWKVGSDVTNVWSLLQDQLVPANDADYLAWLAAGNFVIPIASTTDLYAVIEASYPTHLQASALALETYGGLTPLQAFTWRKEHGLSLVYTGQAALNGLYAIDDQWLGGLMTGALIRCDATPLASCTTGMPGGGTTYAYLDKENVAHTMSLAQMIVISLAIEDHFATLQTQLKVGLDGGTPNWPSLTKTVP